MAKGQLKTMVQIVMALVAFGVIASVIGLSFRSDSLDRSASETACILSNTQRMQYAIRAGIKDIRPGESFGALNCRTLPIEIEQSTAREAENELGKLSARCWELFLQGKHTNVLGDINLDKQCFVCYTVNFPELKQEIDGQLWKQHMKDAIYKKQKLKTITVLDYIQARGVLAVPRDLKISKGRTYAVLYATEGYWDSPKWGDFFAGVKNKLTLGYFDTPRLEQSIIVDYLSNVEGYCEVVDTAGEL